MKILITGTHFTPAIAVIEELKKFKGVEVVYIGRSTTQEGDKTISVESEILPSLGAKFIPIISGRLQREFTLYTIPSLLKIPVGILQALWIIFREKPDVILSFGGYVAVPLVFIGWFFFIPVIVHEQTLVLGLANKISSYFADKIALSFRENDFKGEKVILTGNPIRHEIIKISTGVNTNPPRGWTSKLPMVLVMGGSQGSHAINLAVEETLGLLLKSARVYHQTGDSKFRDYERLAKWRSGNAGMFGGRYKVMKWIGKEYPKILQEADLVVSRAGINTLMEMALMEKPALLVPISNREQKMNARYFEKLSFMKILPQSQLSGQTLLENIKLMLGNLKSLRQKAKEANNILISDAAKRLALETVLLANTS